MGRMTYWKRKKLGLEQKNSSDSYVLKNTNIKGKQLKQQRGRKKF